MLEQAKNMGYGEYHCSRCGCVLDGGYCFVGDTEDEEGHEWRGFCDDCWDIVKVLDLDWVMKHFPSSPYGNESLPYMELVGEINAGYRIILQGDEAVLGHSENKAAPYVAWHYNKGTRDFCWGRYGTKEYAIQAFMKKEKGEYSGS
jgi:hypothetical protein